MQQARCALRASERIFLCTQTGGHGVRLELSREETLGCILCAPCIYLEDQGCSAGRRHTGGTEICGIFQSRVHMYSMPTPLQPTHANIFKQLYRDEKVLES